MPTSRLEAFSDGVLAIIITIMVLELKIPHGPTAHDLLAAAPGLLTYLLSFVYIGIYWNNHHHLFQLVSTVNGAVLWANLHLLFWLSLLPFTTAWMDDERLAPLPTAVYGVDLLLCAIAWYVLQQVIFRAEGAGSRLRRVVGTDLKGKLSPLLYVLGIAAAAWQTWISIVLYTVVALAWLVPDRRFERAIAAAADSSDGDGSDR
ncbi:DUF1211 domain-containing protein [Microlunatus elymi]|uniref:DUF1211 domain-containing protein n=1 Tax=Microlunatus elymi TaxID=2596828 RepID=A0A516Q4S9_9ACTN|nr:TMEM175 family protein [Microlunatus elymi]QDP98424.1 DUF1211 domain-containing protein [Microlunatus elymi]